MDELHAERHITLESPNFEPKQLKEFRARGFQRINRHRGRTMKEHSLKGVKTHEIKIIPDERGFFAEALRKDWKEFLGAEQITQANLSYSYPNVVRAWHKHTRGQIDHFLFITKPGTHLNFSRRLC